MNTIFRYRKCDCLLKYHELSSGYFYLSPTSNENDINEGRPIFKLNGDKFMWEGLFKYFYYYTYNKFFKRTHIIDTYGMNKFINDKYVQETIQSLVNNNITATIPQLRGLAVIFSETCMLYSQLSDVTSNDFNYLNINHKQNLKSFIRSEIYHVENDPNFSLNLNIFIHNLINGSNSYMDNFLHHMYERIYIRRAYSPRAASYPTFVLFIEKLLNQLPKLALPYTYLVSFSTRYNNDNMWANYANRYNGVCLEYYIHDNQINMNNGYRRLYKVHYGKIPTFNLFNFLNIYNPIVRKLFKKALDKRNLSLSNKSTIMKYKKKWNKFCLESSLSKTNDWKRENEYRLIYFNSHNKSFKRFYKFTNIKSVTLGSSITLDDEAKIISVIQQKCKKYSITRFPVYRIERSNNGKLIRSILFIVNNGSLKSY